MIFIIRSLILLSFSLSAPQTLLSFSPKEILALKSIKDVQLSPDNHSVLFVATELKIHGEKSFILSRIYKAHAADKNSYHPITSDRFSSTLPRWSPDGKWIAFLSNIDGTNHLHLMSSEGGEPFTLTRGRYDVQTFSWSPDGQKIAFVMADDTEVEKNRQYTSAAYVYRDPKIVNRLWVIEPFNSAPTPLTGDKYCVRGMGDFKIKEPEFDWTPDSKTIVFSHSPSPRFDDFHCDGSLATVDLATGCITEWEKNAPYEAKPRCSPDGKWVAYYSSNSPKKYARIREVALRTNQGAYVQKLAPTFDEFGLLGGQEVFGWTPNSDYVLHFEPKYTKYSVTMLSTNGREAKELDLKGWVIKESSLSPDRTHITFVAQTSNTPPEVYISKLEDFQPIQISDLNKDFHSQPQPTTEVISWASTDGWQIEGLLTYPTHYQKGTTVPLLVIVHGGPMSFYDESFLATPQMYPLSSFADAGFAIFRPNPRGSCGYGKVFRCANIGDWGGHDYQDIMSGVDFLISKGIANPDKMGIMGWSYGGYMTAWAITQTSRFKAASMGAGVSNLVSMAGTMDLHRFISDCMGGDFNKNLELYQKRSPLYYVSNITTPCLIQHGTEDKRVPTSQSYEFFHALEKSGKEATLVLYPDMEHFLAEPRMLLDSMERNLEWFTKRVLEE